jgi:hypothetical protein
MPLLSFPFHHLTYQIRPYPKSSCHLVLSCHLSLDLDTCQRSRRGLLSFSSYKRNPSLPHSLPSPTVLLCYQIPHFLLSLTTVILLHWFWFLKSLEQLGCYNLFPLNNKEIALEETMAFKISLDVPLIVR